MSRRAEFIAAAVVLALGVVLLGLSAPDHGEFWWSDAPRHALNGVFVKDFVAAMPWHDPVGYATRYYLQYPALTILFYPPLFYAISAPFYAIFGVSHATALLVVLLHDFAFALGLYALARRYCGAVVGVAVGLAGLAAPGIALWARQIMLELPALAFVVWGLYFLRRAGDENERPWVLYLGAFLLLCAVYTKFTAIILAPVAALMLFAAEGHLLWRSKHNWIVAGLFAVGLVPVLILTWKFGQANVQSVTGIADAQVARNSLAAYGWYAMQLPDQLWWPLLVAAMLWPVSMALGLRNKLVARADLVLLFGWFALGYIFFSLIDLKEARHSTLILPPLLIAAGIAIDRLAPRVAGVSALAVVALTAAFTWAAAPVPEVRGYAEAADWIARTVPKDSIVLFSGKRDGSFVFNLRAEPGRGDIATIRSDKLLLDVAVRRELGVKEKDLDEAQIGAMLDKSGVSYVVAQSDFWTDLTEMARLQNVLRSDHFEEVKRIAILANVPTEDTELRIYKNRHPVDNNAALSINLPIIGRSIEGQVGRSR